MAIHVILSNLNMYTENLFNPFPEVIFGADILGSGIDRCYIPRIERDIAQTPDFISMCFTPEEIHYCQKPNHPNPTTRQHLQAIRFAGRWAAKEAVIKSLGGIDPNGFSFIDINILPEAETGQPLVSLSGRPYDRQVFLGVSRFFLSISHERDIAAAWCLAVR